MLDHLASANPVFLCDPMACGKGRQPTREGHG
uniref:Transposase n=1 Tax=Mesocestoides corti TaxID=53468 RepID=A0A5K3FZN2_MESCO